MSDIEILQALKGDGGSRNKALTYLFKDSIRDSVLNYCVKAGCSNEEAKDIFDDGLFRLVDFVKKRDISGFINIRAILFGVCKKIRLEHLKKKGKYKDVPLPQDFDKAGSEEENPERQIMKKEIKRLIREQVLALLDEKCRECLQLDAGSYSNQEIAEKLGYTYDSVRQKKSKCYRRLREAIYGNPELMNNLKDFLNGLL